MSLFLTRGTAGYRLNSEGGKGLPSAGAFHLQLSTADVKTIGDSLATPKILRLIPVLIPLSILVLTGLRGLDFGNHWDEKGWQIGPVKTMLALRAPFPGHYGYPSFNYWIITAALLPDIVTVWDA